MLLVLHMQRTSEVPPTRTCSGSWYFADAASRVNTIRVLEYVKEVVEKKSCSAPWPERVSTEQNLDRDGVRGGVTVQIYVAEPNFKSCAVGAVLTGPSQEPVRPQQNNCDTDRQKSHTKSHSHVFAVFNLPFGVSSEAPRVGTDRVLWVHLIRFEQTEERERARLTSSCWCSFVGGGDSCGDRRRRAFCR
jgi:hypothetical protein